ncbi:LytR/AlgR family response regulator transcription factor [Anaeromicropila herbilytica]|uniref:Stage 0 sporulation protein A homolog n=1 Tax=Anaeromicropila herbilytica TaxID=2785025 RepID=A0A7R7IB18_9FIRM|nr:LytTR family DNA-binding domain-containing protein [Anaeromicropila herbilytica]BCN29103.1 DNA-binding response regulator [Anaeromicropila herbilytica]
MLQIYICDDEKVFRNDLKQIIGTELDLCGISFHMNEFSCGEDLIMNYENNLDKQIIFLDIEMKRKNGIEIAKEIRMKSPSALIIFVTSYSDFVFQGYEVRALNYVMKPYEKTKIIDVLHTALKDLDVTQESCILIEQRTGSIRLPYQTIQYLYSERHTVHVVTETDTHTFYGKLSDIEKQLPICFVRIHNRYIINLRYLNTLNGNTTVINGETLPVSRSCKEDLAIAYAKYMLN